jgi:hypothetical protein
MTFRESEQQNGIASCALFTASKLKPKGMPNLNQSSST